MASNSETGHAKNVSNFEKVITLLSLLGPLYNPSRPDLKLERLQSLLAAAQDNLAALASLKAKYASAVDSREAAYEPVNKLVTRTLAILRSSVSNKYELETAISLADKIRGHEKHESAVKEGPVEVSSISRSQQSYSMIADHLLQYLEVLALNPAYQPNEEELTTAALRNLVSDLKANNNAVTMAEAYLDSAIDARNNLLYAPGTGMLDLSTNVKAYLRGALSADNAQYKEIVNLDFKAAKV